MRKKGIASASSVAAAVVVISVGVAAHSGGHHSAASTTEQTTDAVALQRSGSTMSAAGGGTTSHLPTYLPPGVRLGSERIPPTRSGRAIQAFYSLPGRANADTIPASGLTKANATVVHVATEVVFLAVSSEADGQLPPSLADSQVFDVSTVTINGGPGRLQVPKNGYGAYRVEWQADGLRFTLLEDRLKTQDGTSGLDTTELLRMARSVQ